MSKTLERVAPFLPQGGKAIFMKGPHCVEEVERAVSDFQDDFTLEKDLSYHIPGTPHLRRLVVFTRRSRPSKRPMESSPHPPAREASPGLGAGREAKEIESPNNRAFKTFLKLGGTRGIRKHGLALISGPKNVADILRDFPRHCTGIIFSHDHGEPAENIPLHVTPYRVAADLFRQIDFHDTHQPILLVRVPSFPPWDETEWPAGCTLCVPFQDPANVGAVIRSAAAFGAPLPPQVGEGGRQQSFQSAFLRRPLRLRSDRLGGSADHPIGGR